MNYSCNTVIGSKPTFWIYQSSISDEADMIRRLLVRREFAQVGRNMTAAEAALRTYPMWERLRRHNLRPGLRDRVEADAVPLT